MYKVLLVDDEILIRERISRKIQWRELGYELVGTCENGKEAIAFLEKEEVSLVLTDICMPFVDGLELAKYIHEHKKNTKVSIITGYEEFDYAKKAMEYHVFSYILKPITSAELIDNLLEIRKLLDDEKCNNQLKQNYENSYSVLENQFLLQLVLGTIPEDAIGQKLRQFKIDFRGDCYSVSVLCPRNRTSVMEREQIISLINARHRGDVMAFEGNNENIIICLRGHEGNQLQQNNGSINEQIVKEIRLGLGIEIDALAGTIVLNLNGLSLSYEKAMELKDYLYLERDNYVYEWDAYQKNKYYMDVTLEKREREKRIVLAIQSNLQEDMEREILSVKAECSSRWISRTKVVVYYQSLILAVMNSFERLNIEEDNLFMKEQEVLTGLYNSKHISEMEQAIIGFFTYAMEVMNKNRGNFGEERAIMAINYISEHYSECDLSLQEVCARLAISVSYFSSAFKSYTGMTFVEMLTKVRMDAAKELLQGTSLKTYEIAERCGYNDSNYFSSIFKKSVGKTPREYAKQFADS